MSIRFLFPSLVRALAGSAVLAAEPPKLLQTPTLSASKIAFTFGGDLWIVDRAGGDAHRLTTALGLSCGPKP